MPDVAGGREACKLSPVSALASADQIFTFEHVDVLQMGAVHFEKLMAMQPMFHQRFQTAVRPFASCKTGSNRMAQKDNETAIPEKEPAGNESG